MKTRKNRIEYQREKRSERLNELLELKGISQAELLRRTTEIDPGAMTRQHLSQIIHAKRTLVDYHASTFSEALEVDPGYLSGADGYKASSYSEYVDFYGTGYEKLKDVVAKYDHLFDMIGYKVVGITQIDDSVIDCDIRYRDTTACIPKEELDQFVEDVKKYMLLRIDPLMYRYREE